MLRRIEAALARKRRWTTTELADELGISLPLLRAGIEQLRQMGRLSRESAIDSCEVDRLPCRRCVQGPICPQRR